MEISFLNNLENNNVDRIQFKIENNSENNADVWFSGIKEKMKLYDKDIKFGDSNNHLVLDFFLKEASGTFIFDFYELKKIDLLLKFYFKKFFGKIKYNIDFSLGFGINEFIITASKEIDFNNLVSIEFSYSDYSKFKYVPIYFDVDDNFFTGLNLESKKIVFSTAVAVGFKNPILPNKLPVIFKIRFQITYYKDFDNFYKFFENSVTNFEDEKNFNVNFYGLGKIIVSTCEEYKKMVEMFTPEIVDFKEEVKCEKLVIKNFGKKLLKKNGSNSFLINFGEKEIEIFDEIVFDTNAVPFSKIILTGFIKYFTTEKHIILKNLKNVKELIIENPEMLRVGIENCNVNSLKLVDVNYEETRGEFNLKIKNTNVSDTFIFPFEFFEKIKCKNNKVGKILVKFDFSEIFYLKSIEEKIFGKTGIYEGFLEKFDDKVIATLFFIFYPIIKGVNLYGKVEEIIKKKMGFENSKIEIKVNGLDSSFGDSKENQNRFEKIYSIFYKVLERKGINEIKKALNFFNFKHFFE